MRERNRFFLPREDRRLGDRYQLLECLGDGSYGWVWRAQKLTDDQIVAVKIPKDQGANNEELAEGAALRGQPAHRNVIGVSWMGRVPPEREWYVIEMEYFPSMTLARLLEQGNHGFVTSYAKLLGIYEQVLNGVAYLHSLGMSHGDIKPQNVLVSGDTAKITDYGSSIQPEEMYTRTRENGGTILYSSPEFAGVSIRGRPKSAVFHADIYSLGVLLYHLVTSRLPHDTLSQITRHTPFPRPREVNTSVCPALEEVILRCLAFEAEDRWPSVADLITATQRARRAQLDYVPQKSLVVRAEPTVDWSSKVIALLQSEDYRRAEHVARGEFETTGDAHAFLLMLSAAVRDGRFFDGMRDVEGHPEMLADDSPVRRDVRQLSLTCSIETRALERAEQVIAQILADEGQHPNTLLKKASVLGLQASYVEASEILLRLNREFPGRPAILRRLVLVFEQVRDLGKAAAFLRAYMKACPDDAWAADKREQFTAIGFR